MVLSCRAPLLLFTCFAPSALCLRRLLEGTPPPSSYKSSRQQCPGDGYEVSVRFAREREEREEKPPKPNLWPELRTLLNGTQWCSGSAAPPRFLKKRVALVMAGQAFRSRNYYSDVHSSCTAGTEEVQRALVQNHMDTVIKPLEAMGMQVDVFLTDTQCGTEKGDPTERRYRMAKEKEIMVKDTAAKLTRWYTPERVKAVVETEVKSNVYQRMAKAFATVDEHMREQGGTYEYFVVLRYDIFLDKSLLSTMRTEKDHIEGTDPAHYGLSYFGYAHDWLFFFPAEMWGCMLQLWTECMAKTEQISHVRSNSFRRHSGCFRFGPLEMHEWASGYGFSSLLIEIHRSLTKNRPELTVYRTSMLRQNGTSAISRQGHEYRCAGGWYWPPKRSFENNSMPCYFHVG